MPVKSYLFLMCVLKGFGGYQTVLFHSAGMSVITHDFDVTGTPDVRGLRKAPDGSGRLAAETLPAGG